MKIIFNLFYGFVLMSYQIISSIIKIHYCQSYHSDLIFIQTGRQNEHSWITLDLKANYTWLNANQKENAILKTTKPIQAITNNNNSNRILREDVFEFAYTNKKTQVVLPLYIFNDNMRSHKSKGALGGLGLGFGFSNPTFSIIHQIKQNEYIEHSCFAICNPFSLFLGGIPPNQTDNRIHSYCNVIEDNTPSWNCRISKVILSNRTSNKKIEYKAPNSLVTFTTDNHLNYIPKQFFHMIIDDYFKELIETKTYEVSNRSIYSFHSTIIRGSDITFIIDGYSYRISIDSFWNCNEVSCEFELFENRNGDNWILGSQFLRLFNTLFDYESKQIHFYSLKDIVDVKYACRLSLIIININSLLLLIGIGVVMCCNANTLKLRQ